MGLRGLLQFYFVMIARTRIPRIPRMLVNYARTCALAALLLAGCATVPPPATPTPSTPSAPAKPAPYVEPPPPHVNLQGFPPSYRLGFGDGCSTARGTEKKDPVRFGNDGNYRVGWQDGVAQCKAK